MNHAGKKRRGSLVAIFSLTLIFHFSCGSAFSFPFSEETPVLTPEEAAQKIGQSVTLEGTVVGAFVSPKTGEHLFHFGDAYPKHSFSVRFDVKKNPDLRWVLSKAFVGRTVRVTGLVLEHKPVPTIVLTKLADIQFMPVDESILQREDLDGRSDRKLYAQAWRQKLLRREFNDLDRAATELNTKKTLDAAGSRLLVYFYDGLQMETPATGRDWTTQQSLLEEWCQTNPKSSVAWVALAEYWEDYAWEAFEKDLPGFYPKALGDFFAPLDSLLIAKVEMKARLFQNRSNVAVYNQRRNKAREALEKAERLEEKIPQYYQVLQETRANFLDEKPALRKQLFEEAIAHDPGYRPYYLSYALYLYRTGEEGDWEAFALTHTDPEKPDDLVRYAWLIQSLGIIAYHDASVFVKSKADWSLVKKGFEEMRKRYPNSRWILNSYAELAGEANDPATARALLPELEKNLDMSIWCSYSNYQFFVDWTQKPGGPIWF